MISARLSLFIYSDFTRELHGIFKAESDGTWELKPDGRSLGFDIELPGSDHLPRGSTMSQVNTSYPSLRAKESKFFLYMQDSD